MKENQKRTTIETNQYSFFSHTQCEFFPCHTTAQPENFNCLFCYCPLYALGDKCGGKYKYTDKGIKDCSDCLVPHGRNSYPYISGRFQEIAEIVKKQNEITD